MTTTKKSPSETLRLTLILFAFTAITALCLGLVNGITADRIAVLGTERTQAAMEAVLLADSYEPLNYTGGDGSILGVYKAGDQGFVVQLSISGSQAMVDMVVGVDTTGAVTGIMITGHAETPGLGAIAAENTDAGVRFREQFVGVTGSVTVDKDGGTINSLTGATVTSRAITNAVNNAVAAAASVA